MKIRHVLSSKGMNIISATPDQTLREVVQILAQYNIGAVVVLEGENLVGILSERDIIRVLAKDDHILDQLVRDVMTKNVITGRQQDDVNAVLHTMTTKRFRHLPITDEGALIGVISIGDMVKAQMDEYRGKLDTLETQIIEGE